MGEAHRLPGQGRRSDQGWREDRWSPPVAGCCWSTKMRAEVDEWRADGYPGLSDDTRRLFEYWFEECTRSPAWRCRSATTSASGRPSRRSSAWSEIAKVATRKRSSEYATAVQEGPVLEQHRDSDVDAREAPAAPLRARAGRRGAVQDLPPPRTLRRFAFKMATGSGKTWVMAMAIVWSYFHKKRVPGSTLATNFLIVAPNVIVYQRLEKDFASNSHLPGLLPLVPPEWKGPFEPEGDPPRRGHRAGRARATCSSPTSSSFMSRATRTGRRQNAVDALLGRKPAQGSRPAGQRSMLERIKASRTSWCSTTRRTTSTTTISLGPDPR